MTELGNKSSVSLSEDLIEAAAECCHFERVKDLMDRGADVFWEGYKALRTANFVAADALRRAREGKPLSDRHLTQLRIVALLDSERHRGRQRQTLRLPMPTELGGNTAEAYWDLEAKRLHLWINGKKMPYDYDPRNVAKYKRSWRKKGPQTIVLLKKPQKDGGSDPIGSFTLGVASKIFGQINRLALIQVDALSTPIEKKSKTTLPLRPWLGSRLFSRRRAHKSNES